MKRAVWAAAAAMAVCMCGEAAAQRAPAPAEPAPPAMAPEPAELSPEEQRFNQATPAERAAILIAKPAWDETDRGNFVFMITGPAAGRDPLLRAARDGRICQFGTSALTEYRTQTKAKVADGSRPYEYERHVTEKMISDLHANATAQGSCSPLAAQVAGIKADRDAWAASPAGKAILAPRPQVRIQPRGSSQAAAPAAAGAAGPPPAVPAQYAQKVAELISTPRWTEANRNEYTLLAFGNASLRETFLRSASGSSCMNQTETIKWLRARAKASPGGLYGSFNAERLQGFHADARRLGACTTLVNELEGFRAEAKEYTERR